MAEPKQLSIIAQASPITARNRKRGVRVIVRHHKLHQVMELSADAARELSAQLLASAIQADADNERHFGPQNGKRRAA